MTDAGWLAGKRALVVGAGSGIGRAVTELFLEEGASVGVLERSEEKCAELRRSLPGCPVVLGDAVTLPANRRAVAEVVDAFGGLDVLVSCVGLFDFYRDLDALAEDQLEDAFDEIFRINVASPLLSVKAALSELRRTRGSVVLTASTSAFYPGRGGVLYVASKFALRGLVVSLAHELAPVVRVNGVAPGGTLNTDLRGLTSLGQSDESLGARSGREEELRSRTPLAVALAAADHAPSYVFLASDRSRGTTGTFLHSDGGIGVKG